MVRTGQSWVCLIYLYHLCLFVCLFLKSFHPCVGFLLPYPFFFFLTIVLSSLSQDPASRSPDLLSYGMKSRIQIWTWHRVSAGATINHGFHLCSFISALVVLNLLQGLFPHWLSIASLIALICFWFFCSMYLSSTPPAQTLENRGLLNRYFL